MSKKINENSIRNSFTLDDKLDAVFFIDRVELVKSQEESPPFPVFETVGEYVVFYRRLVGRRIVACESLINKSKEQAVEDEIQHLQQTIAPLVDRSPRTDRSETRFCDIVPVKDQRKVWTNIFTDFPGLLHWKGIFVTLSLRCLISAFYMVMIFLIIFFDLLTEIFLVNGLIFCSAITLAMFLAPKFYYRRRWAYHAFTLREIAQKIVEAKEKYIDYPIRSVDEVEPLLLKTLSECFDIPLNSLKLETRLDTDLGFEL